MAERKTLMEKHADIFFVAPGGVGTMDEFFQVLTLKYLRRINVPIVVLNLGGFYDSLLALINDLVKQGAATEEIHNLYDVVTEVDENTIIPLLTKCIGVKNHLRCLKTMRTHRTFLLPVHMQHRFILIQIKAKY